MEQYSSEEKKRSGFDFKRFLNKVLKNYVWIVASMLLFLAGAYTYLRYSVPLYQVGAFLQIQPTQNSANMIGGSAFSSGGNSGSQQFTDLNGEIYKLQSAPLIADVIDSLKLNVEITYNGRVKNKPLFHEYLPFTIDVKNPQYSKKPVPYILKLGDSTYSFFEGKKVLTSVYGQPMMLGKNYVTINLTNKEKALRNSEYRVRFISTDQLVGTYAGRLTVSTVPKGGFGMLQLIVKDEIPDRAKKFIEVLKYKYDYANYIYRTRALESEIKFLDQRVANVDAELEQQENYVKNFKAGNKITDVTSSANQLLGNLSNISTKKSDNAYKENLLNLVQANLDASDGKEERINVTGLQDPDLALQVTKYNDLVSQKANIVAQAAPRDLRLPPLNIKIEEAKEGIKNKVNSLKEELAVNNRFLATQEKSTSGMFATLPGKEKDFIEVNRLLNIKQQLYVFLLQKKEDKNMEFASSSMTNSRTVDWKVSNVQDPKPIVLYGIAAAAGIIVPAIFIFLGMMMNKKIQTSSEITDATNIPIVGEIAFAGKNSDDFLVIKDKTSPVAEHFRTLRANLFFKAHGLENKVILVTSGISGEGKTFVSSNLANTIAMSGKKTVILEFDLRNPGITSHEERHNIPGIINFINEEIPVQNVLREVDGCENLSVISSGYPLSFNTGEMILHPKMQILFDYLKKNFEYIILDTPPVEAVSDALVLSKWANFSLFVLRHKYSSKSSIDVINRLYKDEKAPNAMLVINSIQPGGDFNNLHGYGYGYGYPKKNKSSKRRPARPHLKIA